VDECATGHHKCDLKTSKCVNKPGTYSCHCKEGLAQTGDNKCRGMHCHKKEKWKTDVFSFFLCGGQNLTYSTDYFHYIPLLSEPMQRLRGSWNGERKN
jgi:hypothetical protein